MFKTIFDTTFGNAYGLGNMAKIGANELQTNIVLDMDSSEYQTLLKGLTPIIGSPIVNAFTSLRALGHLEKLSYISTVTDKRAQLPEILTISDITIYGKKVPTVTDPRFKGAWTNITSMINPPADRYSKVTIRGAYELLSVSVRGLLCMSYEDSVKNWLPSQSAAFLIETYANLLADPISRVYRLDIQESIFFKYAFAHYMANMMTTVVDENNTPEVLHRCHRIVQGGKTNIKDLAEQMYAVTGKNQVTMDHVAEFVTRYGPGRIKGFSAANVYRMLVNASRNGTMSYIAADYPPYMLYMLFRLASGDKHPLFTNILNRLYTRQQVEKELKEIVTTKELFTHIKPNE